MACESSIGMVLFQENNSHKEHVMYYLSKALVGPKLCYSHVEKLALEVFHTIQQFRNCVFLRKSTFVVESNPM
jgi:hypothetical protein